MRKHLILENLNYYKSSLWYFFCKNILYYFSDRSFTKIVFFINSLRFNYKFNINLDNPKYFHEKINYLKFNYRKKIIPVLADKIKVRSYVKEKIGKKYLIDLIGIYKNANEISFEDLPNQFVLKTNHGSGWNIICNNKEHINISKVIYKCNNWLNKNPYYLSREWQYSPNPKLICEKFLGDSIIDYKIFCFEGAAKFIQLDLNRFSKHERCFFDVEWNYQDFTMLYKKPKARISKPSHLKKMVKLAEKLSNDLFFARVDMYLVNNRIYFGEITFYPEGGNCVITPESMDYIMSNKLNLKNFNNI